tara:strand:- start:880 stop:1305 length:426 start_codon:yes stop_codon:yes gene_type:complete
LDGEESSIFTRIINGELPCHKVYEDELVFAFLDINPMSPCHTLVVPKEPAVTLDALSEEYAEAIGRVLPKISRAVLQVSGASEFNVLQNNGANAYQSVFHVHFHIIPKFDDGRGLAWPMSTMPITDEEGSRMASQIRAILG